MDPLNNDKPQIAPEAISAADWQWKSLPYNQLQLIDLEVRRENCRLRKKIASLEWQLRYFIDEWSASETAEIKALLELEDMKRRIA